MQFLHEKRERAGLLIALLGIAILIALSPFASGLLGAAVLYVMCAPLYRRLRRPLKADFAAAVTLIVAITLLVLPLVWVVALLAEQVPDTLKAAQQKIDVLSEAGHGLKMRGDRRALTQIMLNLPNEKSVPESC